MQLLLQFLFFSFWYFYPEISKRINLFYILWSLIFSYCACKFIRNPLLLYLNLDLNIECIDYSSWCLIIIIVILFGFLKNRVFKLLNNFLKILLRFSKNPNAFLLCVTAPIGPVTGFGAIDNPNVDKKVVTNLCNKASNYKAEGNLLWVVINKLDKEKSRSTPLWPAFEERYAHLHNLTVKYDNLVWKNLYRSIVLNEPKLTKVPLSPGSYHSSPAPLSPSPTNPIIGFIIGGSSSPTNSIIEFFLGE